MRQGPRSRNPLILLPEVGMILENPDEEMGKGDGVNNLLLIRENNQECTLEFCWSEFL